MKITLASSNAHKAEELAELFKNSTLDIVPAPKKIEVIEDGKTFQENAYKKAEAYYQEFKMPTLADDSGLVIPARTDILGVQSARYAPEFDDYQQKNQALLKNMLLKTSWVSLR